MSKRNATAAKTSASVEASKPRTTSASTRAEVAVRTGHGSKATTVKFGSVEVTGQHPDVEVVNRNIERGTKALERLARDLGRPGVSLRPRKNVPLYSAADEPGIFIRKLNGRVDRGRLVDGQFKVID